jgi:deoxycytidine triphosphate deaminase
LGKAQVSFLSNKEIAAKQRSDKPLIAGITKEFLHAGRDGPLEAAAVKLRIGEIYQAPGSSLAAIAPEDSVVLDQGRMAFVLTEEEISLPADIGGLMFAKSGGIADRGILITNTGLVDPGYKGKLRYAVINMGNSKFSLRRGDYLVKIAFFRLGEESAPNWLDLHDPIAPPSPSSLHALGKEFAAVETRISEVARRSVTEQFVRLGALTMIVSILASFVLALATMFIGILPLMQSLVAQ